MMPQSFNAYCQDNSEYGKIISISDNTVAVIFENRTLKLGDEIDFIRRRDIIDPVTKKIRGNTESHIAKGVVEDIGLGKGYINITWKAPGLKSIELSDSPLITGVEKKFTRVEKVVGKIQNLISEKEIEIDLGSKNEINEGDMFLIQRTEDVVDPNTKEITGQNTYEIGKGKVSSVSDNKSRAELIQLNPGVKINLETDGVVFEPFSEKQKAVVGADSSEVAEMKTEINKLKVEISNLKTTVDSLTIEQRIHSEKFEKFRDEIENIIARLKKSDISGTKIRIKNDEVITQNSSETLFNSYKKALDKCLLHKYEKAIADFHNIIKTYPDSKLIENCYYWIGQAYFSMGNFEKALEFFNTVLSENRFTHKDDDASIMIGITYFKMGKADTALSMFKNFIVKFPESEYKEKVLSWIKKLS